MNLKVGYASKSGRIDEAQGFFLHSSGAPCHNHYVWSR